jgi:hypothetical protein
VGRRHAKAAVPVAAAAAVAAGPARCRLAAPAPGCCPLRSVSRRAAQAGHGCGRGGLSAAGGRPCQP